MQTIMAGLACGEPNTISWEILRNHADVFVSAPDWVAEWGMRISAAPIKRGYADYIRRIRRSTVGDGRSIMTCPEYKELKDILGLDETSKVLCFSTEGDTDPIRYKDIVWYGKK
mgnify:CR=1 FL=1